MPRMRESPRQPRGFSIMSEPGRSSAWGARTAIAGLVDGGHRAGRPVGRVLFLRECVGAIRRQRIGDAEQDFRLGAETPEVRVGRSSVAYPIDRLLVPSAWRSRSPFFQWAIARKNQSAGSPPARRCIDSSTPRWHPSSRRGGIATPSVFRKPPFSAPAPSPARPGQPPWPGRADPGRSTLTAARPGHSPARPARCGNRAAWGTWPR